jgi:predicted thioesterase
MTAKGSRPGVGAANARYHIDMNAIPIGTAGAHRLLVTPEVCVDFLGDEEARVLSTPHLIGHMEWAARNAIKPFLGEDEDSVGTLVNIRHLAATPVGMSVEFTATVVEVAGRRVLFRVEARDEKELAGEGTHERFVVSVPRLAAKLAAKRSA